MSIEKQNQERGEENRQPEYVQGDVFVEAEKEREQKMKERFEKEWKTGLSKEALEKVYSKDEYFRGQN